GVKDGFIAGYGQTHDLFAITASVRNDVVDFRVIGQHVHADVTHRQVLDALTKKGCNGSPGLFQRHARDVDRAVDAQVDAAVGPDQVLPADRLVLETQVGFHEKNIGSLDDIGGQGHLPELAR